MSKAPVLIMAARSDIGLATAHRFAAEGHPIQLAARGAELLAPEQADITLRHNVPVTLHEFDALDTAAHAAFVAGLKPLPHIAVCAVGLLGNQQQAETDPDHARLVMRSNYEAPAAILALLANHFAARGSGVLVGISSVAGDRGRATNYAYGSAKAGFTAFLSGLRNRLARQNVHVLTVLPGFVATRMTEGMKLPARLTATPQEVADAIARAVAGRRDTLYVKPVWRLIMLIIRNIPEAVFKKMKL